LRHKGVLLGALPETRPAALLTAPFAGRRPQDVAPAEIEHHLEAKQRIPARRGSRSGRRASTTCATSCGMATSSPPYFVAL